MEIVPLQIPDAVLTPATLERFEQLVTRGAEYEAASRAPNTVRSYRSDWRQFHGWADSFGVILEADPEQLSEPLPPDLLYLYMADRAEQLKPATLARHLSAIRHWHHRRDFPSPTDHPRIANTLAGITRRHAYTKRQARPLYLDDLRQAVALLDDSMKGVRDRALLLVGWWGAFRRSELTGLRVEDLEQHPEGILVTLRKSKTDQAGQGRQVPLHYHSAEVDPVTALREWLRVGDRVSGPVFCGVDRWGNPSGRRLSTQAVSDVVKAAAESIGFDPAGYSAHSLRAGFVSECDRRAIASSAVRLTTGHQSDAMLATYTRPRTLFESAAGAYFDEPEG